MRLNVDLRTIANDVYQAAAAVATPSQPPSLFQPLDEWKAPIVSATNVSVNKKNTTSRAPLSLSVATVM